MRRTSNAFWIELRAIDQRLSTLDYYELLGVRADADRDELRAGFERQVRVLHPDRHVREVDPDRQQCLTRVYARVGEAFRVLSNPRKRESYDSRLEKGETRLILGRKKPNASLKHDPSHPQARSLLAQALELLRNDNTKAARAKMMLAKQYDPTSAAIEQALASCSSSTPTEATVPEPSESAASPLAVAATSVPAREPVRTSSEHPAPKSNAEQAPLGRVHPRAHMGQSIRIGCNEWAQVKTFYMHNISRGGMLLRCQKPLPVGSIIELFITMPDRETIELPAEVVRHVAPTGPGKRPGIGVRFIVIPDAVRGRFEELLRIAGVGGSFAADEPVAAKKGPERIAKEEADQLIEAGDFAGACKRLQFPIREFPDDASLRASFHLAAGLMARQRNQAAAAQSHFERALRYDADSPVILRALRDDAS